MGTKSIQRLFVEENSLEISPMKIFDMFDEEEIAKQISVLDGAVFGEIKVIILFFHIENEVEIVI